MRYAILLPLAVLALASFAGCPPRQQAMPASVPPHAIVRGVPAPPPAAPKSTHPPVTKAMYDDIGAFDTPADLTKKIGWAPTKTPLPRVEYGYASRSSRKGEIVYIVFEHDVVVSCPAACVADAGVDVPPKPGDGQRLSAGYPLP